KFNAYVTLKVQNVKSTTITVRGDQPLSLSALKHKMAVCSCEVSSEMTDSQTGDRMNMNGTVNVNMQMRKGDC
ncbi:hypothetical protein F7725_013255, partial [Dissostichus mawsoni]